MICDTLREHIRKSMMPLRSEGELIKILKARLTKREYKLFMCQAEEMSVEYIMAKLKIDHEEYMALEARLITKLNQEKLKQELVK